VNDVLIALSAKAVGATLVTRDITDHAAIRALVGHAFVTSAHDADA
jgi:predicted nucleic acid-binding protein